MYGKHVCERSEKVQFQRALTLGRDVNLLKSSLGSPLSKRRTVKRFGSLNDLTTETHTFLVLGNYFLTTETYFKTWNSTNF